MTDWFARPVLHVTDVEDSLPFTLTGSASRAHGATRKTAERMLHRSTGRAARLSWPTRGPKKLARGLCSFP